MSISETWHKQEVLDSEIDIDNYIVYRGDCEFGTGGVVALYIKNTLQSHECHKLDDDTFQERSS